MFEHTFRLIIIATVYQKGNVMVYKADYLACCWRKDSTTLIISAGSSLEEVVDFTS